MNIEIIKEQKEAIINNIIALLPDALSGDRVNIDFYLVDEDGEVKVDYYIYLGRVAPTGNEVFTILDFEWPDPGDYDEESIEDLDLDWFYRGQVEDAVDEFINRHKYDEYE